MVLRNSISFKINTFNFMPSIPVFHHSIIPAESFNRSEPLHMKQSTRQAYYWRWWWITGGKVCAGRFESG
jgi:hypothetical protein